MRFPLTLALLLAASLAVAGDAWTAYVQTWKASNPDRRPWTLWVVEGDSQRRWWRRDEPLAQLVADRDLVIEFTEKEEAKALVAARSWKPGPRWLLVDADGGHLLEGTRPPGSSEILDHLAASGYSNRRDVRATFLRDHPGHGEALEAQTIAALRMYVVRYRRLAEEGRAAPLLLGEGPGRIHGDDGARARLGDDMAAELVDALNASLQVPDWWRFSRPTSLALILPALDPGASPRLREVLARLQAAALEQWKRNPYQGEGNSLNWEEVRDYAPPPGSLWILVETIFREGRIPLLPGLDPTPGRFSPENNLLGAAWDQAQAVQDWSGFLAFLDSLSPEEVQGPVLPSRWEAFTQMRAVRAINRMYAFARLGRWPEAMAALSEQRKWAGKRWKMGFSSDAFVEAARPEAVRLGVAGPANAPITAPREFMELLKRDPEPDPTPPPAPDTLRLVLWGHPAWQKDWLRLEANPLLASWGPGELRWGPAIQEDIHRFGAMGWTAPRWGLLRGGTILAAGEDPPSAKQLALHLSGAGPSRLQSLDAFIKPHPEQLDARRERFALLWGRMPNAILEPILALDAFTAWIPLPDRSKDHKEWKPDPSLWQPLAARLLPEVETALWRWPSDPALWHLWLSWRTLRPLPGSVHAFALGLPHLDPEGVWRAQLPGAVHAAVGAELRASRRFAEMRDWFRPAWDALVIPEWASKMRSERKEAILSGLQDALVGLGLKDEIQKLQASSKAPG